MCSHMNSREQLFSVGPMNNVFSFNSREQKTHAREHIIHIILLWIMCSLLHTHAREHTVKTHAVKMRALKCVR